MGQKTNPISLRLQNVNRKFDSCWYSDYFYAKSFSRDLYLKNYINNFLKCMKLPQARIFVNFGIQNIKLYPFFCIPKGSRVSLAKNLGLFQNLSKAWVLSSFHDKKSKNKPLHSKTTNLNDNLFFNTYYFSSNLKEIVDTPSLYKISSISKQSLEKDQFKKLSKNNQNLNFLENISTRLLLNNSFSSLDKEKVIKIKDQNFMNFSNSSSINGIKRERSKQNLKLLLSKYYNSMYSFNPIELKNNENSIKANEYALIYKNLQPKTILSSLNENSNVNEVNQNTEYNLLTMNFNGVKIQPQDNKKSNLIMPNSGQIVNNFYENINQSDVFVSSNHKILNSKMKTDLDIKQNYLLNLLENSKSTLYKKNFKYKTHIENFLSSTYNIDLQLFPILSKQNWQSAGFVADEIVYFLERRVSFSRIKNRILRQASMQPFIRGLRITCSGRVGGKSKKAQRATQECIKYGETSLHVFDCKIDFASRNAYTSFGTVGIKVWICFK